VQLAAAALAEHARDRTPIRTASLAGPICVSAGRPKKRHFTLSARMF